MHFFGRLAELAPEQVEHSFDKLRGFVNVIRAAHPQKHARGSITLFSGAGARKPPPATSLAGAERVEMRSPYVTGHTLVIDGGYLTV